MKKIIERAILVVLAVLLAGTVSTAVASDGFATADPDSSTIRYAEYSKSLSALAGYFQNEGIDITLLLRDPRFEIYQDIANRFKRSAEVKSMNIDEYKRVLKFDEKQKRIIDFVHRHVDQLKKAEEDYGVSRYVISSIIGIESNFGENMGRYNPFNTYVSMYAVGYRQRFARAQLEELLTFAGRNNLDVFELKSSYAGAISYAQFIPYSLNKWFVGSDIFDINNNILSVANYLSYFMKRTGSIEKAVLRYNPSDLYVEAVMQLADNTRTHFTGP